MASTQEEIQVRVDRLERQVRGLSDSVLRSQRGSAGRGGDAGVSRISFAAWLQVSGPTFAAMVFGFALLWNGQQNASAQILEMSRSLGRLEGSITGLERSNAATQGSIAALNERIERLGASVEKLSERVSALGRS